MKMHIDFTSCSKREPLIFRHRPSRKYRRELPVKEISDYNMAIELCQDKKSHFPFLFIDECTDKLPSEDFMSIFHIVLTTTKVRIITGVWVVFLHLKSNNGAHRMNFDKEIDHGVEEW